MGTMALMTEADGDTKVGWDPKKPAEVENAQATFDHMRSEGYAAYRVDKHGKKSQLLNKFDPSVEEIIFAPPLVGG